MLVFWMFAILCARVKGYQLRPLVKTYSLYPYAIVELVYFFLQINIFVHNYGFVKYTAVINRVYMYTLIIPILVYQLYKPGIIGSIIVIIGTFLNKFAMSQNNGKMPVFPSLSKITGYYSESAIQSVDNIHIIGDESTKLKILTDIIDTGVSILSIGDVLIHSFSFIVIYFTIREVNKRQMSMSPK